MRNKNSNNSYSRNCCVINERQERILKEIKIVNEETKN